MLEENDSIHFTLPFLLFTHIRYNKLKDEVNDHQTESDTNISKMYRHVPLYDATQHDTIHHDITQRNTCAVRVPQHNATNTKHTPS
jgi:hypothetical protein